MNPRQVINLQCCRASLHTCFWGDCSACPQFCLGWSDVSERGRQKSVFLASISHQQSKQCWKGEMGERNPQQIAFVLKTRQAHDVYVNMMYGGFSLGVWDPSAQSELEQSVQCALTTLADIFN